MISLLLKIAEHQISTATPTAAPPTSAAAVSTKRPTAASQVAPIHVEHITPPLSVIPPPVNSLKHCWIFSTQHMTMTCPFCHHGLVTESHTNCHPLKYFQLQVSPVDLPLAPFASQLPPQPSQPVLASAPPQPVLPPVPQQPILQPAPPQPVLPPAPSQLVLQPAVHHSLESMAAQQSSRKQAGPSKVSSRKNVSQAPPPHFSTLPKLKPVEQVMRDYPGESLESLHRLAGTLACDAIFGQDTLRKSNLSGRPQKGKTTPTQVPLDEEKMEYIKTVVRSYMPDNSVLHFKAVWSKCRNTISKACQTLHDSTKKKTPKN